MSMLIAVLNTNFWLATHVLCITTGYGFGLVAGIIAHIYLTMRCAQSRCHDRARQVLRGGYGTALIALLFTSLGTILGGIWADQSWETFLGLGPERKRRAAYLPVADLAAAWGASVYACMSVGSPLGLPCSMSSSRCRAALGVNLLATGLHSYGFTDKAAFSLAAFCAAECCFAAFAFITIGRRGSCAAL